MSPPNGCAQNHQGRTQMDSVGVSMLKVPLADEPESQVAKHAADSEPARTSLRKVHAEEDTAQGDA